MRAVEKAPPQRRQPGTSSIHPSFVMGQDRLDLRQEVRCLEMLDGGVSARDAHQAELGAALIPVSRLLDTRLFEVVGQGDLVAGWRCARQDVSAGVGDPPQLAGAAELKGEFDGWAIDDDGELIGSEFIAEAGSVIEDAIASGEETSADEIQDVREEDIIGGIELVEAESGFEA